jgi:glycosyltransferase involved in cell wall biosynthesis
MRQFNVSVIIPTFNRPEYLSEAVRSVLTQTCRAQEIIIIDNGSDAAHSDELSMIGNSHESITLIRLQSNKGPGYARNKGIAESGGEWILFLDDDDVLSPGFIGACFESLRNDADADMIITRAVCFRKGSPAYYPRDALGAINLASYKKDPITTLLINGIAVGSCIVRKKVIGSIRFREDIWHGEDTIFWFSLMQKIATLAIADIAFVGVRQHRDKITLMNNSLNPDGSPAMSKETYIRIMIDLMEDRNHWNVFALKIIFKRIADNSWYSLSMLALLMSDPFCGVRTLAILIRKRLYRYGIMLTDKIFNKKSHDLTWLQR